MIEFRDTYPKSIGTELIVQANDEAVAERRESVHIWERRSAARF